MNSNWIKHAQWYGGTFRMGKACKTCKPYCEALDHIKGSYRWNPISRFETRMDRWRRDRRAPFNRRRYDVLVMRDVPRYRSLSS